MTIGRMDPTGVGTRPGAGVNSNLLIAADMDPGQRALVMQARILETIARGAPLDAVLAASCGLVEAADAGALAAVLILSPETQRFTHAVGAAAPASFLQEIHDWSLTSADHRCTCSVAVLQNEVTASLDVTADGRWSEQWCSLLRRHGISAGLSYPIFDPAGAPLGSFFVAYSEPVSDLGRWNLDLIGMGARLAELALEREHATHELRELHERLDSQFPVPGPERTNIWNLSNDLMSVGGFDGFFRSVNPAWTRILDWPEQTLMSQSFRWLVHPDDLPVANEAIERLQRGEIVRRCDERLRSADGSYHWFSWTAVPEGDVFFAIGRDLESLVEDTAAEAEPQHELDHRQRVEATLTQMQRMEALGQLTAGVAHDFNNLLTVVLGNLDYVERRADQWPTHSSQFVRRLSFARIAAEHGAKLIAQLLAFSRRQQLEPKVIDLNEVIGGMRYLLQSTLSSSIGLDLGLSEDLWHALVDPTQLELVVLNLTINARDAMPAGGRLRVATSNVSSSAAHHDMDLPAGDYVVVCVSDTGVGMSADVLGHAFEPFFTTKDVGKGSGLGLAQVYGFAKQSGGAVRIETQVGHGTTVHVFVPRARHAPACAAPNAMRSAECLVGKRILLVDDDPAVRQVTHAMLTELGCDVLEASSGDTALGMLRTEEDIDLLLADFAMPGMNGAELASLATREHADLPVLIVTGYADVDALLDFTAEAVLRKPFRREQLVDKVIARLGNS
ncbi:MAG: response regulator [Steroidobacteraceae bacterium]